MTDRHVFALHALACLVLLRQMIQFFHEDHRRVEQVDNDVQTVGDAHQMGFELGAVQVVDMHTAEQRLGLREALEDSARKRTNTIATVFELPRVGGLNSPNCFLNPLTQYVLGASCRPILFTYDLHHFWSGSDLEKFKFFMLIFVTIQKQEI